MPYAIQEDNYWLKYSSDRDGSSIRCLLTKCKHSTKNVLAIQTTDGNIFGAFTNSRWRANGKHFYGSCESFLWKMRKSLHEKKCANVTEQAILESELEIYPWTGQNRNIQFSNMKTMGLGGGECDDALEEEYDCDEEANGFGIRIDSECRGTSSPSVTFGNPGFVSGDAFEVAAIEVWTMTPVSSLKEAQRLELARAFIFEHSAFID